MDSPYTPTTSYQTASPFNHNTAPPPPPKRSSYATGQHGTPEGGPPLPPPPPPPHESRQSFSELAPHQHNQQLREKNGSSFIQISPPEEGWLPHILRDKSYGLSSVFPRAISKVIDTSSPPVNPTSRISSQIQTFKPPSSMHRAQHTHQSHNPRNPSTQLSSRTLLWQTTLTH